MRAADLFQTPIIEEYRKRINPPYSKKDIFSILATLFILLIIPLTILAAITTRDFRKKAAEPTVYSVPVLSLRYFPTSDGVNLNSSVTGITSTLASVRLTVNNIRDGTISALDSGSIYHGYKDQTATPSLNYTIYEEKELLKEIPKSTTYAPFPDHFKIFSDSTVGVSNICDYVENKGVKEVWIWMYHTSNIVPIESNMAGPYGDISNSDGQPDLPVCAKTYTVYEYNYSRGVAEAVEDHTHQIEAVMKYVDYDMFWNKFVGYFPDGQWLHSTATTTDRRCGWTHFPPNGTSDYDWENPNGVYSDCENWTPDGLGVVQTVNCHTWSGTTCADDGGLKYKIWWMQNIPGKNNNLSYKGSNLRNWWEFFGDFDATMAFGKWLYLDETPPTVPTGLSASNIYSSEVTLTWNASTDNSGVKEYQIKRDGNLVGIRDDTALTDYTLTAGRSYQYTVSAIDVFGNVSSDSAPLTVLTNNNSPPAISKPFLDSKAVSSGSVNKIEWYQYVGNGPNRLLVVSVGMRKDGATDQVESVSYKDTALTKIGAVDEGGVRTELWRLINPPTGYEKVTVNMSIGVSAVVSSMVWYGVDQTNPTGQFASSMGWGSNPFVNVQSGTNEVVIDSLTMPSLAVDLFTEGSNQTKIWDKWIQGDTHNAGSQKEGASTVSMTWNTKSEAYAQAAVSLKVSIEVPCPKTGDLNCDNSVNINDLSALLNNWGAIATSGVADINKDGVVNILDLSILLSNWGS